MSIFERIKRWWHSDIHARFDELERRLTGVETHAGETHADIHTRFDNLENRAMIFRRPMPEKAKREPRKFDYENR